MTGLDREPPLPSPDSAIHSVAVEALLWSPRIWCARCDRAKGMSERLGFFLVAMVNKTNLIFPFSFPAVPKGLEVHHSCTEWVTECPRVMRYRQCTLQAQGRLRSSRSTRHSEVVGGKSTPGRPLPYTAIVRAFIKLPPPQQYDICDENRIIYH